MIGLPLVVMVFVVVVVVVEVVVFVEVVVGGVIVIVIGVSCSRSFLLSLYESVVQVTVALSVGVLVAAVSPCSICKNVSYFVISQGWQQLQGWQLWLFALSSAYSCEE